MFYPDKNVIICKPPFINTGRDNPQYSFEELMSKGCLLILQNNFLLHELLLLASLSDAAEIVSAPRNRTVLEYDNVTFFCNASSNPPSQIIWTQEGSSTVLHTGETFVIENVSRKLMDSDTNAGHGTMSPKMWRHMLSSPFIVSIQ